MATAEPGRAAVPARSAGVVVAPSDGATNLATALAGLGAALVALAAWGRREHRRRLLHDRRGRYPAT